MSYRLLIMKCYEGWLAAKDANEPLRTLVIAS